MRRRSFLLAEFTQSTVEGLGVGMTWGVMFTLE
jgi:hypothetical protein